MSEFKEGFGLLTQCISYAYRHGGVDKHWMPELDGSWMLDIRQRMTKAWRAGANEREREIERWHVGLPALQCFPAHQQV